MLDPGMRQAVALALTRARTDGRNEAEVLDDRGLLLTSYWRKQIESGLLEALIAQLEDQARNLAIGPGSPAEAVDAVVRFVRLFAAVRR